MYAALKSGEISLWCDTETHQDKESDSENKKMNGAKVEEDDVDEHFKLRSSLSCCLATVWSVHAS